MELDNARGWRPEVGNVITGEVVAIEKGWSDQAEKFYPIVTIRPEKPVRVAKLEADGSASETEFEMVNEAVAVHCFHTVLYMRVVELKPGVGERIGIKYVKATEKIKGGKGNTPAVYNVRIDGRSSDVWGVMQVDERVAKAERAQREALHVDPDEPDVTATDDDDIPF